LWYGLKDRFTWCGGVSQIITPAKQIHFLLNKLITWWKGAQKSEEQLRNLWTDP